MNPVIYIISGIMTWEFAKAAFCCLATWRRSRNRAKNMFWSRNGEIHASCGATISECIHEAIGRANHSRVAFVFVFNGFVYRAEPGSSADFVWRGREEAISEADEILK